MFLRMKKKLRLEHEKFVALSLFLVDLCEYELRLM